MRFCPRILEMEPGARRITIIGNGAVEGRGLGESLPLKMHLGLEGDTYADGLSNVLRSV